MLVKRYSLSDPDEWMDEDVTGHYVLFEDYQKLEDEISNLRQQLIKEQLRNGSYNP